MHEASKFELLNLAGGLPAKRTLLLTAISRYRKTTHPKKPTIKLPTMELPKLTKSLFSQRQGAGRGRGGKMNQMCICYAFFAL